MKKNIFALVLNWKRPKQTNETLKYLKKMTVPSDFHFQILVIDNNSKDNSVNSIKKSHSGSVILENPRNDGYAGGNNVGMKYALNASADYILVLNNDLRVDKNLLKHMLETAQKDPANALITPKIYFEKGYEFHKSRYKKKDKGKVIWSAGGHIDWNNVFGVNRGIDEVDKGQYEDLQEVEFATGACFLIRRNALVDVGFFDERFFMYLEDADLCIRLRKAGHNIVYDGRALSWHKVSQSSSVGGNLSDYFLTRNRLFFAHKYASNRLKLALHKQAIRILISGRKYQRKGVLDFYRMKLGKGSWES